jgi:hypothetical protein
MSATRSKAEIEAAFAEAVKDNSMCKVGRIVAESENGDVIAAKIEDDLHYSAAVIARVLKGLGYGPLSSEAINKHRHGTCRCAA